MNTAQWAVLVFGGVAFAGCIYVLRHHDKYWMTEAIIVLTLPLVITASLFIAISQPVESTLREFFSLLSAVIAFIGGYAAAEKKAKS